MPTYNYVCNECGTEYELTVSVDDRNHQCCKDDGNALTRLFRFTGSVWAPTRGGSGYA